VGKPCCHNVFDGQKMIEASRKYNVRVQVRFQNRSGKNLNEAMKFLHEGGIGDVYMARGFCLKPRDSFGIAKDSEPHATLHYDTWLGLAPYRPYNEKRVHYNYHWFWDTGNGDKGAQRPHQLDVCHWDLGKDEHPVSVYSTGGLYERVNYFQYKFRELQVPWQISFRKDRFYRFKKFYRFCFFLLSASHTGRALTRIN